MPFYENVTLETQDDLKLRAYLMLQGAAQGKEAAESEAPKRPTVLFLHANAGNMVRCAGRTGEGVINSGHC